MQEKENKKVLLNNLEKKDHLKKEDSKRKKGKVR